MSEDNEIRKQTEEEKPEDLDVNDDEAEKVGGGVTHNDLSVTKTIDKSSPILP
jgi:type VI protein secretion system component Hcp